MSAKLGLLIFDKPRIGYHCRRGHVQCSDRRIQLQAVIGFGLEPVREGAALPGFALTLPDLMSLFMKALAQPLPFAVADEILDSRLDLSPALEMRVEDPGDPLCIMQLLSRDPSAVVKDN